jgi:hypothetical protein
LLRIATDVQSPLDHQQHARATLAALLAWEVDPGEGDVCFPGVIESEAFTAAGRPTWLRTSRAC